MNVAGQSMTLQCSGGKLDEVEESVDCVERDGKCCSVNNTGVSITWYSVLPPGDYYACGYCWSGSAVFRINMGNKTPPLTDSGMSVTGIGAMDNTGSLNPSGLLKTGGIGGVLEDKGIYSSRFDDIYA